MRTLTMVALLAGAFTSGTSLAAESSTDRNPRSHAPAAWPEAMDLNMRFSKVMFDRLEAGFGDEADTWLWDAQAWYGGDFHKLWIKTEGGAVQGEALEEADVELLYSRNVAAFWDFQAGIRYDLKPSPERAHLAIGVQGLAPYMFEIDATAYLREDGLPSARVEAEYDLLITQRLILQPRFEGVLQGHDSDAGTDAGLASTQLDIRLRYEFVREFAPYIGFSWTQKYGDVAAQARRSGEPGASNAIVLGLCAWF